MSDGGFGVTKDEKGQVNLGLAFQQHVLDVIVAVLKRRDIVQ